MDKPSAPSCERNRDPILEVLRNHFADRRQVLEIGSGTGQHAVHFAAAMPHLQWQCTDRPEYLPGIRQWLDESALPNTPAPFVLDVSGPWPAGDRQGPGPLSLVGTARRDASSPAIKWAKERQECLPSGQLHSRSGNGISVQTPGGRKAVTFDLPFSRS